MDKLDKAYKIKQFFRVIYGDNIGVGGNFMEDNYVRIFQNNSTNNNVNTEDKKVINFFNNIDDMVKHCIDRSYNLNTYYSLSLTNGQSGQSQDLTTRTVLGWDFDKKDLGENFGCKDILERFKAIKLWYHCLIDSGHGFHVYTCIDSTNDIERVAEVQKAIGVRLGADLNAVKTTQILRIPYTYNIKEKPKQVNIIKMFKENIKRYNLDNLYNRFCCNVCDENTKDNATIHAIRNTNLQPCIVDILKNGSIEGNRYLDLQKIVVLLRSRNKPISEIQLVCKDWATKSKYNDDLEYRVENIFNNLNYVNMNCKGCEYKQDCFSRIESDFEYSTDTTLLTLCETQARSLKNSDRKGVKVMKGNDLLLYGILKNHSDGLYREELIKEMTFEGKCLFGEKPLSTALGNLEENGFIEVKFIDRKKIYKLKDIRNKIELTYNISYGATYECVKRNISTEELRLYNYMRYLHHKQQREDPKALKGNLFQFTQIDLAKEFGTTQGRISQMITNLLDQKILGIWYRQPSRNNGHDFYIYRLVY